jgi:carbonic anhydrase/acetyltransferase-like protein (isoleucine patch superfamily)
MPSAQPIILPYRGIMPRIDATAFVAPGAVIIGDVEIGPGSSIWFGCVVRGDVNKIRIGSNTNIQDGSVIHVASGEQPARLSAGPPVKGWKGYPTIIGDNVTVGHMTLLHACTLEDSAFVGMHASVMDGAVIEGQGMLAAGATLTPGKRILRGQLWAGTPAKFWRDLNL